jgi:Ca2+-transporting ATPase
MLTLLALRDDRSASKASILGLFTNPYLLGAVGISALLQMSIVLLPFARPVFEAASHFAWEWMVLFLLALIPAAGIETVKWARARRNGRPQVSVEGSPP